MGRVSLLLLVPVVGCVTTSVAPPTHPPGLPDGIDAEVERQVTAALARVIEAGPDLDAEGAELSVRELDRARRRLEESRDAELDPGRQQTLDVGILLVLLYRGETQLSRALLSATRSGAEPWLTRATDSASLALSRRVEWVDARLLRARAQLALGAWEVGEGNPEPPSLRLTESDLKTILEGHPEAWLAHALLAQLRALQGRREDAIDATRRALRLNPELEEAGLGPAMGFLIEEAR